MRFPTTDGLALHGWFIPAQGREPGAGPAPTVLHVHGNAGDVCDHRFAVQFLPASGFNVLLFDYRGFGQSGEPRGPIGRRGLLEDTHAALDYLLARDDVDPGRIAVFGYSLGAVIGLAAAERPEVRAVVAYAGFSTWKGVAGDHGGPLGRWLIPAGTDAVESVRSLAGRPLLVVHGTRDRVVPYRHAERITEAAGAAGVSVELLRVEGGDHISIGSDPSVHRAVVEFLRAALDAPAELGP